MRLRLAAGLAGVTAGVLALAPASHAAEQWLTGPHEDSVVISCASVQSGTPIQVVGASAFSEKFVDKRRQPRVGKTFYVRVLIGAVGDPCVPAQTASVELIPPLGVRVATSPRNTIDCFLIDILADTRVRIPRADGCPRFSTRGVFGGRALNRTGPLGPNWAIPIGKALEIQVPVRSNRRMKGRTRATAGCQRTAGQPPCPRRLARNHLQFAIRVFDGNANPYLVPHLGLTVRARERRRPRRPSFPGLPGLPSSRAAL
jgi:hypothetical protein